MRKTIAVLFGGQSSEHPVSLMSATVVLQNMPDSYDLYPVGITTDGRWFHYQGSFENLKPGQWELDPGNEEVVLSPSPAAHGFYRLADGQMKRVDAVFPMLHGRDGEDGTIAAICQMANIICVGCDMTSSAVAMDKEFTHIICESAGIPMAKYHILHKTEKLDFPQLYEKLSKELKTPFYVKPTREGSSFGAHKVSSYQQFEPAITDAFKYDSKILVEEFISGNEVGCGILGQDETGVVYEVVVDTEMYGYAEKYEGYKTHIYYPAKSISAAEQQQVIDYGRRIYQALGCQVFARCDFFASDHGIIFNEINTIPGFTSHSLYPSMFKAIGYDITTLLSRMINAAFQGEK